MPLPSAWVIDGGAQYMHDAVWFGVRLWYLWLAYLTGIVIVTIGSGLGYFIKYRKLYLPEK